MNKTALVAGGVFFGAGVIMLTQERRIDKIHKMYENLITELAGDTYTRAWTDGKFFGAQEYRRQAVQNALMN